jgi:hypothetical protein
MADRIFLNAEKFFLTPKNNGISGEKRVPKCFCLKSFFGLRPKFGQKTGIFTFYALRLHGFVE